VCGENLIDYLEEPSDDEFPLYRARPGGSPYNTALAMGKLGLQVGYNTPISTDALGSLLRGNLEKNGVTCLAKSSSKPTALAVVSTVDGQPAYQFYRDNTADRDFTYDDLQAGVPKNTVALYIGGASIAEGQDADHVVKFAMDLHKKKMALCWDPNIRPAFISSREEFMTRFALMVGVCDLIKMSDEDVAWLYPGQDPEEVASTLFAEHKPALLILTKGSEGSVGFATSGNARVPAGECSTLVDTVGAGDTFMAATIAELFSQNLLSRAGLESIKSEQLQAVLQTASAAAAINCGRAGCQPPTKEEIKNFKQHKQ